MSTAIGSDGSIAANMDYGDAIIASAILYRRRGPSRFSQVRVSALPGGFRSEVAAVNHPGMLVGNTADPADPGNRLAVSWTSTGAITGGSGDLAIHLLQDQIPAGSAWASLDEALSIDDAGEIIGQGTLAGSSHPFILIPAA